ncbi:Fasciculation and elongation protein zeta-2 [Eufriesea mexicana]|nr:Fasciculation and elongation protein zeta-2 [Eufriesea mexicana]
MRDMAGKIAELKFEAPLARFEEEDTASLKNMNLLTEQLLDTSLNTNYGENCNANEPATTHENGTDILQEGTFSPFSGSLEDLVNTFDEKITSCFRDYGTNVESLAPVQVRTQEEIMNECQMWWTITGTFGNILPIDWSKSYARKMHMPALNLNEAPVSQERPELEDLSSEDEAVATDLDMHALILSSSTDTHSPEEPLKTAEEVLREIDDIMQESPSMERSPDSDGSLLDSDEALERSREVLCSPLHEKKLKQFTSSQLTELLGEMESLVGALSETLIAELALRDELEYEKELKNQFISLLLAVQNRRRQHHVTKKRNQMQNGTSPLPQHRSLQESKYLTTVIPYHTDSGPPDNQALQVLIKILKAISEDSPTVPTLLTDYILKEQFFKVPWANLVALFTIGTVSTGYVIHYSVQNRLRRSITYKKALDIFYNKEETLNRLGKPIQEGKITIKENENNIKRFSVNVKGSKSKGILNFEYQVQPDKTNEIKKAEIQFNNIPHETVVIHNIY